MNKHKILFFVIVLLFVFFFGFLATYSHNKMVEQAAQVPTNSVTTIPTETTEGTTQIPSQPTPTETNPSTHGFGTPVTLQVNSSVTFSDGFTVTLKHINDSRCPKDVQCVWAGELGVALLVTGGNVNSQKEVLLGTVTKKTDNTQAAPYSFVLHTATASSATITVFN